MGTKASIEALETLGFTRVEAEAYVYLVQNSPATGYAVANGIDRTKGATYKVLRSLQSKGAIVPEESRKGIYRAIPPGELLAQLERDFLREKKSAERATRDLRAAPSDERIYRLTTMDQIYERARSMLRECTQRVLIDIFPEPFRELRRDIEKVAGRDVKMLIHLYEEVDLAGARIVLPPYVESVTSTFPAHYLCICRDAAQFMVATVSTRDQSVINAYWSSNPLYSWTFSVYVKQSLLGAIFETMLTRGTSIDEMKETLDEWYDFMPSFTSPGYLEVKKILDPQGAADAGPA